MNASTTTPLVTPTTGPTPTPTLKIPSFWYTNAGMIVFSGVVVMFVLMLVGIVLDTSIYSDVTWASRCLKWPTTRLVVQLLVQTHIKDQTRHYWSLDDGTPSVTGGFPSERVTKLMTSSNGNIFHVTGHLCGEFTGRRLISLAKASDAAFWCFLWSAPEYLSNT